MEKLFPQCGKLFATPIAEAGRYGTVEFGANGFVTAFREKAERTSGFVNTGVYLLPRALIAATGMLLVPAPARVGSARARPIPPKRRLRPPAVPAPAIGPRPWS